MREGYIAVARPTSTAVAAGGPAAAAGGRRELKVVHTALHGVGDGTLRAVLASAGWPAPVPVAAQQQPDPAFPTVPYPNPEAPGVLDLAAATAEREGADLVLANDPDADRLAVMVPGPEGWRMLTGDELGALLGHAVLTGLASGDAGGPGGRPPVVATTVVSGSLLRRLAQAAGVRCVTTLTGFKWIARAGGADGALVYGYEQALGYAVRPDLVADKDGISAALLVLQLAAEEARAGRALADRLDDLALAHGVHVTRQRSLRADGAAGLARLADAVERVRQEPPRGAGRAAGHGDRPARGRRRGGGPGGRPRRALPGPADSACERTDLARRRRRAPDDPAERHRARAQDLRRGRPAGPVARRACRRAGSAAARVRADADRCRRYALGVRAGAVIVCL